MPTKNSMSEQIACGSVAAVAEVGVNHPFWTMKTRYQTGDPFPFNPHGLYRGFWTNIASMVPITVAQMVAYDFFQNQMFAGNQNMGAKTASAFAAGAVPAVFACPAEMVMTHMTDKRKFRATVQTLRKEAGFRHLYSGFAMTAMRDGGFTVGYMVAPEFIKPLLQPYCKTDEWATFWSRIVAGVGAAVVTQPFDTIKTAQQSGKTTVREAMWNPYKGGMFRCARVVSAVCVMSTVKENLNSFFHPRNIEPDNTHDAQKPTSEPLAGK